MNKAFRASFEYGGKINWFPGHMIKASKEVRETLKRIDIVLEIRDSRAPISSENPLLSDIIKEEQRENTSHVIIFNKADLSNHNLQKKIQQKFENRDKGVSVAFTQAAMSKAASHAGQSAAALSQISHPRHPYNAVVTAIKFHKDWLNEKKRQQQEIQLQRLQEQKDEKERIEQLNNNNNINGSTNMINTTTTTTTSTPIQPKKINTTKIDSSKLKKELNLMVIGLPNLGKSSIINSIRTASSMAKSAKTGALPGVTKHISGFRVLDDPPAFLVDTPGIMIPGSMKDIEHALTLAAIGSISERIIDIKVVADFLLFKMNQLGQTTYVKALDYPEGPTDDIHKLLSHMCMKHGFINNHNTLESLKNSSSSHNSYDYNQASKLFLQMYRDGKFGHFSLDKIPP
ncbi:hypothetical protein DFA_05244 [Cavenderia fasciculata]|uniref:G domain-containing protein n=1 Tax=Cavenderia fasciculata TaxID=261658 RepID=F4PNR1_CACFS|nr:uncharacterized protein DFA_05244 [Cavenderia fasciculata]EGG23114.1 hypothetical protein DFA_05244 [Cavenderia fasciculata]|eukprot:XP_004360965.1 hypothetical protein DFA_05244 [Cavenderia fasciculata]